MKKLIVDPNRCPQNHRCPSIAVCPKNAISQSDIYALPQIDDSLCIRCGKCIRYCPKQAFSFAEPEA